MLTSTNNLVALIVTALLINVLLIYVLKNKSQNNIKKSFSYLCILMLIWLIGLILQATLSTKLNISPIYFDYFVYIGSCMMPVSFYHFYKTFSNTKYKLNKKLLIIPILSLILLWTNDLHHLFYKVYSTNINTTEAGWYFTYIYSPYTLILYIISLIGLTRYSIKNAGLFSKQAILFLLGTLIPLTLNLLGSFGVINMSIYITPICFSFTILIFAFAIFRFNFLKVAPIALQTIVDRISDSYVILNDDYEITDYNETFVNTFKVKNKGALRGKHFAVFLKEMNLKDEIKTFAERLEKIDTASRTKTFRLYVSKLNKTFNVEISSIMVNGQFLGILVLFKDITQHINDMQALKNNQELLIEQERLASLGQMIGGIAHNLKTPIFSVAGGLEGLSDLIKEYDESIDDPSVNNQDMHDIANDMNEWIVKLREHVTYMSDVITTVKGQAVSMSEEQCVDFPVSELFQHVEILMQHMLKEKLATLEIKNDISDDVKINGNINSLVQVINNLISNAIEAYGENQDKKVELSAKNSSDKITISVKDFGPGLSDDVKNKLFKEMITTKGKNGTGLGLFMSYSNIKAHFNGDVTFETSSKGTTFNVIIPIK